jgi:hypothetical protein
MNKSEKSLIQHFAGRVVELVQITNAQGRLITAQKALIKTLKRQRAQAQRASQHRD